MPLPKSILLVEDDADDQYLFQDAIRLIDMELELSIAGNGHDALMKLKESTILPDLVVLDLNMPKMDGIQCLKELRLDPRLQNLTVVMYTTSASPYDERIAMREGATGFVQKPSDYQNFCSMVRETVFRFLAA